MILTALAELDRGEGVPVNIVSKTLFVDPSFVTTQSKMLEELEEKGIVASFGRRLHEMPMSNDPIST
jgi:Mn-dependent DtxR family transcriptional regulator